MDDSTLKSLFEKISCNDSLRRKLMEAIQLLENAGNNTYTSRNTTMEPTAQDKTQDQQPNSINVSLVADEHQLRGING